MTDKPQILRNPTEDQEYCRKALSRWVGGDHHLPNVYEWGMGICISVHGDISTFDWDRLTYLLLIAHRYRIRIEISSSGPRAVRVIAHRRKAEGTQSVRHPELTDLVESCCKALLWGDL